MNPKANWRVDIMGEFDAATYTFTIEEAHKIGMASGQPYIITKIEE